MSQMHAYFYILLCGTLSLCTIAIYYRFRMNEISIDHLMRMREIDQDYIEQVNRLMCRTLDEHEERIRMLEAGNVKN